ncbi:MAG: DUF3667 domain-containing protein [Crocinitomicaceae bacterium]|nr:DUF3667 domain-containing protein [Crocinitomicaceae bacterium]
MNCKNCGHSIQEDQKYCSNCGQKNKERLTFKSMMGELASAFLSWDSKFFNTIIPLITKPGKVSKEYREGKRQSFVAPLRLYLFFSALFFLTLSMREGIQLNIGSADSPDPQKIQDDSVRLDIGFQPFAMQIDTLKRMIEEDRLDEIPAIKNEKSSFQKNLWKRMLRVAADGKSFVEYIQNNISIMLFFFLPAFGVILWLFFLNKKFDYMEHLIYGVYFHSFFFLMLWFTMVISMVINSGLPQLIGILYMLIYLIAGVKRYYETSVVMAIVKSIFIALIYFLTFVVFVFVTLLISIMLF